MFTVLIVDDEEPVLDSYEFMLKSFSEGEGKKSPFTLAGKARTGYEALRLIHELKPDLVFMDINIPTIDGLAVLEDVYKKYPRMALVLSTAYERFDMAQRAIPLGVFAYLVKPVSKSVFFSTLEKALIKLHSSTLENTEYTESRFMLFRQDIWTDMDEQRWSWYRETLSFPSDYGIVLIIELERNMEIWGGRIAEALSFKYHCTYDIMLNRGLFLICEDINPETFRKKTEKLLEKLLKNVSWHYGLGGCRRGPQLHLSCGEAMAELTSKQTGTDAWSRASGKIAKLRQKISIYTPEESKSLFITIWEPLFLEDFASAKLRMVSFFTLLVDDLFHCWSIQSHKSGDPQAFLQPAFMPVDPAEIMELSDLGAWKRWAEINFEKLLFYANLEGSRPQPLVKALAFIRENYTRGIQLTDAAEAARVNTAHLSRLFSEHLKTNFIDYLTSLRINEAQRLLKEKCITVKEASYAVGYQDPNYFTKIFKKVKGILPTEVRELKNVE